MYMNFKLHQIYWDTLYHSSFFYVILNDTHICLVRVTTQLEFNNGILDILLIMKIKIVDAKDNRILEPTMEHQE